MFDLDRRDFFTATAASIAGLSLPVFAAADSPPPRVNLRRSRIERGLRDGLKFRPPDREVLNLIQGYSDRQVMIGGGVLTFAAEEPTEWIHLIVQLADIDKFVAIMREKEVPWAGGRVGAHNSLSFEHKEQLYYLENLMGRDFDERIEGLSKPGTEHNGFLIEFAHDSVQYDVIGGTYLDPFDAIGRKSDVELKRVAPQDGARSAIRALIAERTTGIELPRDEQRAVTQLLEAGLDHNHDGTEEAAAILAGVSRACECLDERDVRDLMTSDLTEETVEPELGEDTRHLEAGVSSLRRRVEADLNLGALWHLSMRAQEQTDQPPVEVEATLALSEPGGYEEFYTKRDLAATSKVFAGEPKIARLRKKHKALAANAAAAARAKSAEPPSPVFKKAGSDLKIDETGTEFKKPGSDLKIDETGTEFKIMRPRRIRFN